MTRERPIDKPWGDEPQTGTIPVRRGRDGVRRVDADALLGGDREVWIVQDGQPYRLRRTASGKLILTK